MMMQKLLLSVCLVVCMFTLTGCDGAAGALDVLGMFVGKLSKQEFLDIAIMGSCSEQIYTKSHMQDMDGELKKYLREHNIEEKTFPLKMLAAVTYSQDKNFTQELKAQLSRPLLCDKYLAPELQGRKLDMKNFEKTYMIQRCLQMNNPRITETERDNAFYVLSKNLSHPISKDMLSYKYNNNLKDNDQAKIDPALLQSLTPQSCQSIRSDIAEAAKEMQGTQSLNGAVNTTANATPTH